MLRECLKVSTPSRTAFVEITAAVAAAVQQHGITSGTCVVYVPHTTAGVLINERADPAVMQDMEHTLDRMAPWNNHYRHEEGNSAAHVKAALIGNSQTILIENGRLLLGTWQGIFFAEFDGPRTREVWLSFTTI